MLLEKFANKQLTVTETWEKWRTTIEILREKRIEHERKIEESTKVQISQVQLFLFLLSKEIYRVLFDIYIRCSTNIIRLCLFFPDDGMGV